LSGNDPCREAAFIIRFDPDTLHRSATGSITANIHIEFGKLVTFPEAAWSDFVVVILGWWLEALDQLSNRFGTVDLMFMDGPFVLRVKSADLSTYTIECAKQGLRETTVVATGSVDSVKLIAETHRVGTQVVEACDARGWQSSDIDALRTVLERVTARARPH